MQYQEVSIRVIGRSLLTWIHFPANAATLGFHDSSAGKESACNAGDPSLISGTGRSTGEEIGYPLQYSWASLVAQLVRNLPVMQETCIWSWVGKIPWRRERLPTPVFCPGEFHGQGIQVGYSPWGHKESDMTKKLTLQSMSQIYHSNSNEMLLTRAFSQCLTLVASYAEGSCHGTAGNSRHQLCGLK